MKKGPFFDKKASLTTGILMGHLGQNLATKAALSNRKIGRYVANGFAQGAEGLVDKSLLGRAKRTLIGGLVPDIGLMHKELHTLGQHMAPLLQGASTVEKAGLRHLVNKGKILRRLEDPVKNPRFHALKGILDSHFEKKFGVGISTVSKNRELATGIWRDKKNPLLSNIANQVGRNRKSLSHLQPGNLSSNGSVAGSLLAGVADPGLGVTSGVKAAMGSEVVKKNKYGNRAVHLLHEKFVTNPIKKGLSTPGNSFTSPKDRAYEYIVSPTAMSLSRTSSDLARLKK